MTVILLLAAIPFILIADKSSANVHTSTATAGSHTPIYIEGNAVLASFIANESLPGDGTSASPYIIENLIIDTGTIAGIEIRATNAYLIIRECTIERVFLSKGIYLNGVTNVNISNNTVTNSGQGIYLKDSSNNILTGNTAKNNYIGIFLDSSSYNTLIGNTASNNVEDGISLSSSSNNTLSENVVNNNIYGISLESSLNSILSGNNASYNKFRGIYVWDSSYNTTLSANVASYNNLTGISLAGSYNTVLSGNNASYNHGDGIALSSSHNTTLSGNTASYNHGDGIALSSSHNTTLVRNTASYNHGDGIALRSSYNTPLSENTANNNFLSGIVLSISHNTTLSGNNVSYNHGDGIALSSSHNTTIFGNIINYNNVSGIILEETEQCLITWNLIFENQGYGVTVTEASSHNSIHHNNFLNNNNGSIQACDNGTNNHWHDTSINEGNCWEDYPETGEYLIDGVAVACDLYPLKIFDIDGDGMPNWWEAQMGLNPSLDDANEDLDSDGLPNLWEYQNGFKANDSTDAVQDSDNDGLINLQEYDTGTDPCDADSDNDFFPDGLDHGWWGNPRKNWDNPLIRALGIIFPIISIGLILWIGYMRHLLPKIHQEIHTLSQDLEQQFIQFQTHVKVTIDPDIPLNLLEFEAEQLQYAFQACQETLQKMQLLGKQKWVPSFLLPDLTHLETNFITVQHSYEEFQRTWLKRLGAKY